MHTAYGNCTYFGRALREYKMLKSDMSVILPVKNYQECRTATNNKVFANVHLSVFIVETSIIDLLHSAMM